MNRRDLLRLTAAGGLASLLPAPVLATTKAKPLRVAHLTDVHILPGEKAPKGFALALKRAYELKTRPDLILIGGDCVLDAAFTSTDAVRKDWAEWHAVLRDYDRIPIHAVLGNHDYHWTTDPTGDALAQRTEGAKWAIDELKMSERFSTFDAGGWRFLLLDSPSYLDRKYHAELDGPQMEWLKAQIATTPKSMPIFVLSHIPIFSVCGYNEVKAPNGDHWEAPTSWMHADALILKELFKSHGNVKLCVSGHMHQIDDITFTGTRYLCAGAISGNWWRSVRYFDTDAGFLVADLHRDGRVETQFITYNDGKTRRL